MNKTLFRLFSLAVILALMVSFLPSRALQVTAAVPTELFFSEYIEGLSYNKALEIYNGTGAAIDLAAGGYSILMSLNGGTSTYTINLTGSVADGDVYVVAPTNATNATILAQADLLQGTSWFNGNDAIILRKGTTILDVIGQIGYDPGTEWGTGLPSTADNTLRRKCLINSGDPIGTDIFDPSIEWEGFAVDNTIGLGAHCKDPAPIVASITPPNGGLNIAFNANISITFSEPVFANEESFDLTCNFSGQHDFTLSGGPQTFILDPDIDFSYNETCFVTVLAETVTDQDLVDPLDGMTGNFMSSFAPISMCGMPATLIHDVQGTGDISPLAGSVVTIEGVVIGDYQGLEQFNGYFLQEELKDIDSDQITSEGIFIYNTSFPALLGDLILLTGKVTEYQGQTQITPSSTSSYKCGIGSVEPVDVNFPTPSSTYLEQYEGMLVTFPQALSIAEYYNYDRYGEIMVGLPLEGQSRLYTPTSVVEPGAPAVSLALENSLRRITLDDASNKQNPPALRHPNGGVFSLQNLFRGGDTVENMTGVMDYRFNLYRIQPTKGADFVAVNLRPATPEAVGSNLKIAAMNTLNYFLTADFPTGNPLDNKCGPLLNMECRGWDSDQPDELTRQRTKLLQALFGLDTAVIGLNEVENTPGVEPLADIVAGLNALYGYEAFAYIDTGVIGTDAIKVGLIYQSALVTPVGDFKLLTSAVDPRFIDTRNRPSLAQTFEENSSGARFTVAVNHLKSKGSVCVGDPDLGDGAGNCNLTRTEAAKALVDWLAADPTGSGDTDFIIMGDLNSYAMEDPIDAIKVGPDDLPGTADDYTNLIYDYQGLYAYSYVFDGQNGYLDHALANVGMASQVTGVADWHINADEPDVLDYDTSFKPAAQDALYEPNQYRTSDHDAVIVGLNLNNPHPTANAGGPYTVNEGKTITVRATGSDPEGKAVTFAWDLDDNGSFETPGQTATFNAVDGTLDYTINVQVTDETGLSTVASAVVTVLNVAPSLGPITAPIDPVAVNTAINISAAFTDPGILDTHTASIDWGDGSFNPGSIVEANGSGLVNGSHAYTLPGLYLVTVTLTDKDGGTAVQTSDYVVIYDPTGGFVTGGGWINSLAGAYKVDPSLAGKATFGFVSKYKKGATVPDGNTEFQFKTGNLTFKSTSYEWLVIAGSKAQFKGQGTINGEGSFYFMITADDGKPDTFRIKIWSDQVIYDNGSQQTLGGGSIVIHK